MKYEMRIPPGVAGQHIAEVLSKCDVELKQTDYGPVLYGEKEELESARDFLVNALNERIKELERR